MAHNYEEQGMKVLVLKPAVDSKIQDSVSSRIGIDRKVDYLITSEDDIFEKVAPLEGLACEIGRASGRERV